MLHDAEITLGTLNKSGSAGLGPFSVGYSASVSFSGGSVNLTPPNIIELANCNINYSLSASFSIDLNDFLPEICLPSICFLWWCTPSICIGWPTITVPLSFPEGTPRIEHRADRVIYNYGSYTVEVHFLPDGSVDVVYNSGLRRAL